MEKIWLNSYPPGVPEEIDLDTYHSVTDVFEQAVKRYGESPCFCNLGTTLTYNEMDRYTDRLARYLQNLPGLGKGRSGRCHDAERAAEPYRNFRHPARRVYGR